MLNQEIAFDSLSLVLLVVLHRPWHNTRTHLWMERSLLQDRNRGPIRVDLAASLRPADVYDCNSFEGRRKSLKGINCFSCTGS